MTATTQRVSLFAALANFGEEIQAEKQAAAKRAGIPLNANGTVKKAGPTPPDPGGYMGKSEHVTANEDNSVQAATEGARSAENTSDVKKQITGPSVDSVSPLSQEGRQDEVQLNIGTTAAATGEDSSVEDKYKDKKDDPGSSHPARTDNEALDGHKYAGASFADLYKKSAALGNEILAGLATGATSKPPVKQAGAAAPPTADEKQAAAALSAGYALAESIGLSKEAAAAEVQDLIANSLVDAQIDADLLAGWLKQAADEAEMESAEDHSEAGDLGSGAGEGTPGAPPPGGAPPEAGPPGGDVPLEQQGATDEEAVQELAMALQELGLTPQDLLAMLQGGMGGQGGGDPAMGGAGGPPPDAGMGSGGGGMPPMGGGGPPMGGGGGPPPMGGDPMMAPAKVAAYNEARQLAMAVTRWQRSGKFQIKEARTKRARQLRDTMKSHLQELLGNA